MESGRKKLKHAGYLEKWLWTLFTASNVTSDVFYFYLSVACRPYSRCRSTARTALSPGSDRGASNGSWSSWRSALQGSQRSLSLESGKRVLPPPGRDEKASLKTSRPSASRTWTPCSAPSWTSWTCGWYTIRATAEGKESLAEAVWQQLRKRTMPFLWVGSCWNVVEISD